VLVENPIDTKAFFDFRADGAIVALPECLRGALALATISRTVLLAVVLTIIGITSGTFSVLASVVDITSKGISDIADTATGVSIKGSITAVSRFWAVGAVKDATLVVIERLIDRGMG
jgi:hypothetical protein